MSGEPMSDQPVAAAALTAALPAILAGDAGCILPDDLDPDAMALLALLEDRAEEPWTWRRSVDDPGLVALDRPVLGLEIAAPDPVALAVALEHLADHADRAVPEAQVVAERLAGHGGDCPRAALRAALSARLRRVLAGSATLAGARFRPAALAAPAAGPPVHPDQDPFHAPEVQDHRAVIPPRSRSR